MARYKRNHASLEVHEIQQMWSLHENSLCFFGGTLRAGPSEEIQNPSAILSTVLLLLLLIRHHMFRTKAPKSPFFGAPELLPTSQLNHVVRTAIQNMGNVLGFEKILFLVRYHGSFLLFSRRVCYSSSIIHLVIVRTRLPPGSVLMTTMFFAEHCWHLIKRFAPSYSSQEDIFVESGPTFASLSDSHLLTRIP